MTVNKEKWQEIAEKYNTKAKWAEALLMLNPDDHDDLISALIELDPQDLVDIEDGYPQPVIASTWVSNLATEKIEPRYDYTPRLDRIEEIIKESEARLTEAELKASEALEQLDEALASNAGTTVNLGEITVDPEEIAMAIKRELGRGL